MHTFHLFIPYFTLDINNINVLGLWLLHYTAGCMVHKVCGFQIILQKSGLRARLWWWPWWPVTTKCWISVGNQELSTAAYIKWYRWLGYHQLNSCLSCLIADYRVTMNSDTKIDCGLWNNTERSNTLFTMKFCSQYAVISLYEAHWRSVFNFKNHKYYYAVLYMCRHYYDAVGWASDNRDDIWHVKIWTRNLKVSLLRAM